MSEGPCRCPHVPVLSHAAGQGAGVRHYPGAAVCSARDGFYGRGWSGAEAAGHGRARCRGTQTRVAPPARPPRLSHAREMGCGLPGDGGKRKCSSQIILGALQGLHWVLSGGARNTYQQIFRVLPLSLWCSQGSLHTSNPQPRHLSLPPNEPSHPCQALTPWQPLNPLQASHPRGAQPLQLGETPGMSPPSSSWAPHGQRSPLREGLCQETQPEAGPDPRSSSPQAKQAESPPFLWDPSLSPSPGDSPRVRVLPVL